MAEIVNIQKGQEARESILKGVKKLVDSVSCTMGAGGRNVLIEKPFLKPILTKDGVSVAKPIFLEDKFENMGAQVVKEVAQKTVDEVGDGPQPLYAKVLTPNGWKMMGELKIGDELCGTNGSVQKVLSIYPKGKKDVYQVVFRNGEKVECCLDHTWTVRKNFSNKYVDMTLKQIIDYGIKKGSKYIFSTPESYVNFNEQQITLDPYLLGVLLGDGYLGGHIEISLGKNKQHIIEKLILPEGNSLNVKEDVKRNSYKINITSDYNKSPILEMIKELNLYNIHSPERFIPKNYLYNTKEIRQKLLQGLIDTDGHVTKTGLIQFTTTSKQLAEDILELIRGLGKRANLKTVHIKSEYNTYSKKRVENYRVTILKGSQKDNKIVNITKLNKQEEMMCIKVSNDDSLYYTNDYILTHNTTTATVLTGAIYENSIDYCNKGYNPVKIKRNIESYQQEIIEYLESNKKNIENKEDIFNVANISANGDTEIANVITEAIDITGVDGIITVENSPTTNTTIEYTEGLQFNNGYVSPYFINNQKKLQFEYENCLLLIISGHVYTFDELSEPLNFALNQNKPIVIIANDYSQDVINALVTNRLKQNLKVCAVRLPYYGEDRQEFAEDLSIALGCSYVNTNLKETIRDNSLSKLFDSNNKPILIKKVTVDKNNITFINDNVNNEAIEARINYIKSKLEASNSPIEQNTLRDRISKLVGSVAIIRVGGSSEIEVQEKKDRIDDALHATKASIKEGVVIGGGLALLKAVNLLCEKHKNETDKDKKAALDIIRKSLYKPATIILSNAGYDDLSLLYDNEIASFNNIGYNVASNILEKVDMFEAGIIDPILVTKTALINSISVAGLLMTTESAIALKKQENEIM